MKRLPCRYLEPGPDGTVPAWDESEFLFLMRTAPAHRHPQVLLERYAADCYLLHLAWVFMHAATILLGLDDPAAGAQGTPTHTNPHQRTVLFGLHYICIESNLRHDLTAAGTVV